jgi:hypothetical protein
MGTTLEKLEYLLDTKEAIYNSLIAKGAFLNEETPFRLYAYSIDQLEVEEEDLPPPGSNIVGRPGKIDAPPDTLEIIDAAGYSLNTRSWTGFVPSPEDTGKPEGSELPGTILSATALTEALSITDAADAVLEPISA